MKKKEKRKGCDLGFFRVPAVARILESISWDDGRKSSIVLAKELDISYSHVNRIVHCLGGAGVVFFKKKDGRTNLICLTERGKVFAETNMLWVRTVSALKRGETI